MLRPALRFAMCHFNPADCGKSRQGHRPPQAIQTVATAPDLILMRSVEMDLIIFRNRISEIQSANLVCARHAPID